MPGPRRASKVKPEAIEWLWRDRIPLGKITTVAGRPDQGKGLFAAHVSAAVSQKGNVLYSAPEDDDGSMTRPRLEAAGADLDRVDLWEFQLPDQMRELAQLVIEHDVRLIVMDPFAPHLGHGVSRHSDNVRTALGPLTKLIESTGTAVLIIEHALKRIPATAHPLNAIGGSGSGLPAASRAAFVFGVDPEDDDRRVLVPVKFNLGRSPKALAFEIDICDVQTAGEMPLLIEAEELEVFDPMRLFANKTPGKVGRSPDKRAAAGEWLTVYLATAGGPVAAGLVQEDAKQHGMAIKTLRRAADDMGIVKSAKGGPNVTWDLPDDVKDLMGVPRAGAIPAQTDEEAAEADDKAFDQSDQTDVDQAIADLLARGDDDGS